MITLSWWALALRGVLAILFGLLVFLWPGITLFVLLLFFGAHALIDGVLALVAAFRGSTSGGRWWAMLIQGILGIATGIVTFVWPGLTAIVLLYFIAIWAIVIGIFEIAAAIRLRKEIEGEWLLALRGVLAVLFGVILIVNPGAGALAVVWTIGVFSIALGVLELVLAVRLRSHHQRRAATA
ncbi:MAG: HdeD family acid-resistance protein [Candidatus Rokuibacteriota bacterium]